MTMSHVELYEALKGPVGAKAARMIADVVPPAADLATKVDVAALKVDIADLRAEMHAEFGRVYRLGLTLFAAQWLGVVGIIVTVLLRG